MFLPITPQELNGQQPDIVYVIGEAYCDHPSFGHAIVSRLLESLGMTVAILSQPQSDADYLKFGEPKVGFFVSSGVVDSMVNNYTVAKRRRDVDVYSEGGDVGRRPDRCVDVYCHNLKRLFPGSAIVIGGIEASLRRFAHYDYWADRVMPSILVSSGADLLIYGMGERPITDIIKLVQKGVPLKDIRDVRGTCYLESYDRLSSKLKKAIDDRDAIFCPSFEQVRDDKKAYVEAFNIQSKQSDHVKGKTLLQKHLGKYVVQNKNQLPLSPEEMDKVYELPYMRDYHPSYMRGVPAMQEVKFSLTSVRGCFGSCNYCALTYHQGRIVQKRSKESLIDEAKKLIEDKDFKGYIHDVGGPTANFRDPACKQQFKRGVCAEKPCIGYRKCPNMQVSHEEYVELLRELRQLEGVKKVFVRSGIRYDYVMYDKDDTFLKELVKHHVSGQLKVAPEHVSESVLEAMNKPPFSLYLEFKKKFDDLNARLGKKQYLVPYLISSHPGCTLKDAVRLAEYLKSIGYMPEQVQDFYPTPSTKSTCMYYTGINPDTGKPIYVPKDKREKMMQRALMQWRKKSNYDLVHEALVEAGRRDLIGFTEGCLIKPTKEEAVANAMARRGEGKNVGACSVNGKDRKAAQDNAKRGFTDTGRKNKSRANDGAKWSVDKNKPKPQSTKRGKR